MNKYLFIIFEMIFVGICSLLCVDIINTEMVYNKLETLATSVSLNISKSGGITNSIKQYVKKSEDAEIYCANEDCDNIKSGDTYYYIIEKEVTPILIFNSTKLVQVKKSIVIGLIN